MGDPASRQPENGVNRLAPIDYAFDITRIDRHQLLGLQLAAGDWIALDANLIFVRTELCAVTDPDGRRDKTHIHRRHLANLHDSLNQIAALIGVDQRYQLIAHLDFEQIDTQIILRSLLGDGRFDLSSCLLCFLPVVALSDKKRDTYQQGTDGQKRHSR